MESFLLIAFCSLRDLSPFFLLLHLLSSTLTIDIWDSSRCQVYQESIGIPNPWGMRKVQEKKELCLKVWIESVSSFFFSWLKISFFEDKLWSLIYQLSSIKVAYLWESSPRRIFILGFGLFFFSCGLKCVWIMVLKVVFKEVSRYFSLLFSLVFICLHENA